MESENKPNLRLPLSHYEQGEEIDNKDFPLYAPGKNQDIAKAKQDLLAEVSKQPGRKPTEEQIKEFGLLKEKDNVAFWQNPAEADYSDLIPDDKSTLSQTLEVDDLTLGPKRLTPVLEREGQVLGSAFLQALRSTTNTGGHAQDYMYSSGFWIKVGDFSSESCFRTASKLKHARDNIGLETNSLLFSNDDVHIRSIIVDYILDHTIDSNLENWQNRDVLEEALLVTDTERLMGLALDAMYPAGYPLIQDCKNMLAEDKKCDYVTLPPEDRMDEMAKLNFLRTMVLVDPRFGTDSRRFLLKEKVTLEEVKEYQAKLLDYNNASKVIGTYTFKDKSIKLRGSTPSYALYKNEGLNWIANVIDVADSLVTPSRDKKAEEEERTSMIASRVRQVMTQRQMAWIDRVTLGSAWNDSRSDIEAALSILAENRDVAERVKNDIRDWSKKQVHGLCAIPNWTCPSCKKNQPHVNTELDLIPISMSAYFFSILVVRAYQSTK